MVYRAIGLMSGSSLDGLDIAFVHLHENAGKWDHEIICADCYLYETAWKNDLQDATRLNALDYQLLHAGYGHYLGRQVNRFIDSNNLHYQVQLIASHGHTSFHRPDRQMTAQLGDGAAIAAVTGINVVSDLRAMDVALGGQGAPIVPIAEKLLFNDVDFFLNLGGIANISHHREDRWTAFDICPANSILNRIAGRHGLEMDEGGALAASGKTDEQLLDRLNGLVYYGQGYPKSLDNLFGLEEVYPLIQHAGCNMPDALRTYTEHIAQQISQSVGRLQVPETEATGRHRLLSTGGGTFNHFLMERIGYHLSKWDIQVVIPAEQLVRYKEALAMALIGVLRWREAGNAIASATGARRDSIGGAVWIGQEP